MEESELKQRLKEMIVERLFLKIAPEQIEDDAPLMDTYGIDSVALFEVVVGIEEVFGIIMDDSDFNLAHFRTLSATAEFVQRKLAEL